MGRLSETLYDRDKASYLSTLVHDEWLENIMAGHDEKYQEWHEYAAWLILKCVIPEQNNGTNTQANPSAA